MAAVPSSLELIELHVLHWIEGASHVALYDKDEYVTPAVAELSTFFAAELSSAKSQVRQPVVASSTRKLNGAAV